jgi:hypothetical protein
MLFALGARKGVTFVHELLRGGLLGNQSSGITLFSETDGEKKRGPECAATPALQ